MKIFSFTFFALLVGVITVVNAAPPMPDVVANSDAAIRILWTKASEGVFANKLSGELAHLQDQWAHFLSTEGEGIIMDYHNRVFQGSPAAFRYHGGQKFLKMVKFQDTKPYTFNTETDVLKPAMATSLVEKFAERLAMQRAGSSARQAEAPVDTELRLGLPGSSRS